MKKRTKLLINKKKRIFIIIGLLSFLCLISAIVSILFVPFYRIESRVNSVYEYSQKDTKDYSTVGWLRVQGTNIDYPIIYAPDYDLSLKMDDFLWTEIKSDQLLNKVNVIGHNILNLSKTPLIANKNHKRFEQLMSFTYFDFVKDNKYIQYTFNGEEYLYKVFSVSYLNRDEIDLYIDENLSKEQLEKYIEQSLEDSIFKFNIDVNGNDKILSLITCTRMFDSSKIEFKVDARLVRKNELKTNYSVEKTDKYQEIENIMKGGKENEKA